MRTHNNGNGGILRDPFVASPITDPRRLLNGFTFALDPIPSCYVLGCYEPTTIGRLHKRAGNVDSCQDHDPERCGYAIGFGKLATVPATVVVHNKPNTGPMAPLIDRPISRPPSGQKAEVQF